MEIKEKLVKYNFSSRNNEQIKYIVIHDTGNTGKESDTNAYFNYFNSCDRQASAHYFVDDKQILRIIKDEDKAWHCGDGKGKYNIANGNSIGIEMCINSDGDFEKTKQNTLYLIKILVEKYNIDLDNIVRHYDASRKTCPYIMSKNNWEEWEKFKETIKQYIENENIENSDNECKDYTEFITVIYDKIFGRIPDEEGLNYWNGRMKEGLSHDEFMKEISKTEEFIIKHVG